MFLSFKPKKFVCILTTIVLVIGIAVAVIIPSRAIADSREGIAVPVIMYHSILKDESCWNDYVLSPIELEKDIIYLKQNGYTSVFISDLISYVEGECELPEKPVVLTFDDGSYNNLSYVLPLLEKYDFKATFSVVGKLSEIACEEAEPSPSYSYMDWADISKLLKSGKAEIANHSYDMHSTASRMGASIADGESFEEYQRIFYNDTFKTQKLLKENCSVTPAVYTYPYGATSEQTRALVKSCGFKASLGVEEKLNYIVKGDRDCLYDICRFNRPSFVSTEEFMKKIVS